MSSKTPSNLVASVSQRLLNVAKASDTEFQFVLVRYGLERLMYRLSLSPHGHLFTVKGAMMFLVWSGEQYRPTKDLDLMTSRRRTADELAGVFRGLCSVPVEDDGLPGT
jgi:hypothetical protein